MPLQDAIMYPGALHSSFGERVMPVVITENDISVWADVTVSLTLRKSMVNMLKVLCIFTMLYLSLSMKADVLLILDWI